MFSSGRSLAQMTTKKKKKITRRKGKEKEKEKEKRKESEPMLRLFHRFDNGSTRFW